MLARQRPPKGGKGSFPALLNTAIAITTGVIGGGETPQAAIVVKNSLEDRKTQAAADVVFTEREASFVHLTNNSGGERAFRLVQETYCGWLQQQIADFQAHKTAPQYLKRAEN